MRFITLVQLLICFILLCAVFREGSCCKQDWLWYGQYCFRIYTEPLANYPARLTCVVEGSILISMSDQSVFQYLNAQLGRFRGDLFWVGLQYYPDEDTFFWLDGTPAVDEPWVKPYIPEELNTSEQIADCFAYNGTLIVQNVCSEKLGYICGYNRKKTTRTVCNRSVDPKHSFIGEATGNCLFRAPDKTTNAKVEELCNDHQGQFVDLDHIMKDGLTAFYDHKVLANDGSKYWTGLTWIGTDIISSESLPKNLSVLFINGTGSCITVQFNFTNVLETHLYQTECGSEAYVVCSKTEETRDASTTAHVGSTEQPLGDTAMPSCPHGFNWKEDSTTGYCYWETSFETDRMPWDDAELYCQSYGGHLASFHSLEEEKIGLRSQYGSKAHPYWIGLKLDPETETYKWSDGTPLDYSNWAPGHPDHKDKSFLCVAMVAENKHWVSSICGIHSWFVCRTPKRPNPPIPITPTPVPLPLCDSLADLQKGTESYFFEGSCYFIVHESYSWHKAKQFCENEGSTLASIHSYREVEFLLRLLYDPVFEFWSVWIGLNALGFDGSSRWTDRSPVDFTYFDSDEPDLFQNDRKCCNMNALNGSWNDENCNANMNFICKRKNDTSGTTLIPSTPDPTIGNCKKGWIPHHYRCYYLGGRQEKDRANWTEAADICMAQGGHLTSLRDDKDLGFLSYSLQSLGVDVWIGLHKTIQSGSYYWVDHSNMKYTNWAPGEPSFGIKENCVKMVYDTVNSGIWKNEKCGQKMGYICYYEKAHLFSDDSTSARPVDGLSEPPNSNKATNGLPTSELPTGEQPTSTKPAGAQPAGAQPTNGQSKYKLPRSAFVVVIIFGILIVVLLLMIVVYLHKISGKKFCSQFSHQGNSYERALYNVNSGRMEFRDY